MPTTGTRPRTAAPAHGRRRQSVTTPSRQSHAFIPQPNITSTLLHNEQPVPAIVSVTVEFLTECGKQFDSSSSCEAVRQVMNRIASSSLGRCCPSGGARVQHAPGLVSCRATTYRGCTRHPTQSIVPLGRSLRWGSTQATRPKTAIFFPGTSGALSPLSLPCVMASMVWGTNVEALGRFCISRPRRTEGRHAHAVDRGFPRDSKRDYRAD